MTYCGHLVGLPSRFLLYIKELIGLIIPRVLGLIIPRAEKGVELIGSTLPGAMDFGYPNNGEGSGVDWFNPFRSTGFNYSKNGEGNCSNRVSAVSKKDWLRDSGEWSYGSRFSPSGPATGEV